MSDEKPKRLVLRRQLVEPPPAAKQATEASSAILTLTATDVSRVIRLEDARRIINLYMSGTRTLGESMPPSLAALAAAIADEAQGGPDEYGELSDFLAFEQDSGMY